MERVSENSVGNPSKTMVQDSNRRRWKNVMNLWKAWQLISWKPRYQIKEKGQTNYNVFTALTTQGTNIYLTKTEAKQFACVLVPLTISNGTLPTVGTEFDGTGVRSDVSVGSLTIGPDTTVSELAKAMMNNNQNFQKGDILTFVAAKQELWPPDHHPHVRFRYCSLPLDPHDGRPLAMLTGSEEAFCVREGCVASTVSEGACAWVHERPAKSETDSPMYSTQTMWCSNDEMITRYSSEEALMASVASYKQLKIPETLKPGTLPEDLAGRM